MYDSQRAQSRLILLCSQTMPHFYTLSPLLLLEWMLQQAREIMRREKSIARERAQGNSAHWRGWCPSCSVDETKQYVCGFEGGAGWSTWRGWLTHRSNDDANASGFGNVRGTCQVNHGIWNTNIWNHLLSGHQPSLAAAWSEACYQVKLNHNNSLSLSLQGDAIRAVPLAIAVILSMLTLNSIICNMPHANGMQQLRFALIFDNTMRPRRVYTKVSKTNNWKVHLGLLSYLTEQAVDKQASIQILALFLYMCHVFKTFPAL